MMIGYSKHLVLVLTLLVVPACQTQPENWSYKYNDGRCIDVAYNSQDKSLAALMIKGMYQGLLSPIYVPEWDRVVVIDMDTGKVVKTQKDKPIDEYVEEYRQSKNWKLGEVFLGSKSYSWGVTYDFENDLSHYEVNTKLCNVKIGIEDNKIVCNGKGVHWELDLKDVAAAGMDSGDIGIIKPWHSLHAKYIAISCGRKFILIDLISGKPATEWISGYGKKGIAESIIFSDYVWLFFPLEKSKYGEKRTEIVFLDKGAVKRVWQILREYNFAPYLLCNGTYVVYRYTRGVWGPTGKTLHYVEKGSVLRFYKNSVIELSTYRPVLLRSVPLFDEEPGHPKTQKKSQ